MVDEVLAGGATYFEDLPLVMGRHGFDEETYFTFSYSPVVEPGGDVAGLLDTAVETTQRVLATRRMAVLQRLGSLPRSVACEHDRRVRGGARGAGRCAADCPFGLVYLPTTSPAETPAGRRATASGRGRAPGAASSLTRCGRRSIPARRIANGLAELLPGLSQAGANPAG